VEGCVVGEELDVCKRVEAAIVMVVLVRQVPDLHVFSSSCQGAPLPRKHDLF
jgi:hypothetical protein